MMSFIQLVARLGELRRGGSIDEVKTVMCGRFNIAIRDKTDLNLLIADNKASKSAFPDARERATGKWFHCAPGNGISTDKFYNSHGTERGGIMELDAVLLFVPRLEYQLPAERVVEMARAENTPHI